MGLVRHHSECVLEQHLAGQILVDEWRYPAGHQDIERPLPQLARQGVGVADVHMVGDAGVSAHERTDDIGNHTGYRFGGADPDQALCRVGAMLDLPHALQQLVEDHAPALDQKPAAFGELDPLRRAIEKRSADSVLQVCHGLGDGRLGQRQVCRRLGHAAQLGDGLQRMQVLEPDAAADAIVPLHARSPFTPGYRGLAGYDFSLYPALTIMGR
jgi:hypothetical protein